MYECKLCSVPLFKKAFGQMVLYDRISFVAGKMLPMKIMCGFKLIGIGLCSCVMISCSTVKTLKFQGASEDIALSKGTIYTATARRGPLAMIPGLPKKSAVSTYDILNPGIGFVSHYESSSKVFHPVGVDFVENCNIRDIEAKDILFVINAAKGKSSSIVLFKQNRDRTLTKLTEIDGGEFLLAPNGIAVTRSGMIFVSNFNPTFKKGDRIATMVPVNPDLKNSIVVYDASNPSKGWSVAAVGLAGPNGLALTADDSQLVCASYFSKKVHLFSRNGRQLTHGDFGASICLDFHPDNIKRAGKGEFTVTGQNSIWLSFPHILLGSWIPCPGQAQELIVSGNRLSFGRNIKGLKSAPSTTVFFGENAYTSRIINPGIQVTPRESTQSTE